MALYAPFCCCHKSIVVCIAGGVRHRGRGRGGLGAAGHQRSDRHPGHRPPRHQAAEGPPRTGADPDILGALRGHGWGRRLCALLRPTDASDGLV
eukprot:scaffold127553_cov25-Prasinocladus_malaysianus.AAC.2